MFCRNCGTQVAENAVSCPACGSRMVLLTGGRTNMAESMEGQWSKLQRLDVPNTWHHILACCIPIAGLILYFQWKDELPRCAHEIAKWSIVGLLVAAVLWILTGITIMMIISSAMILSP